MTVLSINDDHRQGISSPTMSRTHSHHGNIVNRIRIILHVISHTHLSANLVVAPDNSKPLFSNNIELSYIVPNKQSIV